MRHVKKGSWLIALLLVLAMLAAACGDDDDNSGNAGGTTETTAASSGEVPSGGTLVVGAEQEPDCVDWMGSCGGSSWGYWMMGATTMPRSYDIVRKGDNYSYEPSSLLDGPAVLKEGDPATITYKISTKAKWSDGTAITSKDFKFTWEQVANGKDIYDRSGYDKIASVDDSDPQTAVVTFKPGEFYADWKGTFFGGQFGIYPAHLVKDHSELANGYTWSGGPWKIDHWTKGTEAVLVPNENYWGTKPKLDKIVFRFIADTAAEFQAFKAGEVDMIYPQPQLDVIDALAAGIPGTKNEVNAVTGNAEAFWMNMDKAPFNDKAFREGFAYAVDRAAIVKRLFGKIGVDKPLNTFTAATQNKYAQKDAYAKFTRDLDKVKEVMEAGGWAKGTDGIWAKGGQKASFEVKSTAGNARRELTEQVAQQQLKEAGFEMKINNQKAGDLFGDQAPKGDFQVAIYANVLTSIYPSNCNLFCAKNVPTAENDFSGNNWYRVRDPKVDAAYSKVDTAPDDNTAVDSNQTGDKLMAENVYGLPLDPLPNILVWHDKVVGSIQDNAPLGPFFYSNLWGIKQ